MNRQEALELLGLQEGATPAQIASALETKQAEVEAKKASSASEALAGVFDTFLQRLQQAEAILLAPDPSSVVVEPSAEREPLAVEEPDTTTELQPGPQVQTRGKVLLITLGVLLLAVILFMAFAQKQRRDAEQQAEFNRMMYDMAREQAPAAKDPLLEQMDEEIALGNKDLPKEMGDGVRADRVSRDGRTIGHYYTLLGTRAADFDLEQLGMEVSANVVNGICSMVETQPETRAFYRDEFVYEFIYLDGQGETLTVVSMQMQDCP
ncbi:hypothetical protein [Pseudomaricurvus sp. HS19]|uniref:hypothetical protein n=1 Tax=Pseudomaricurvus sp. HS19 TaxID=2692626 RepID=UPI001370E607|nr:hypothetical protein [Pseudomaricurvus sp. HS19]MYM64349.1 hypothetical protein [Pseudomaricurvus sp. HS19]